jgi:hypothetical protein
MGSIPLGSTNKNKGLGVIAWPLLFDILSAIP